MGKNTLTAAFLTTQLLAPVVIAAPLVSTDIAPVHSLVSQVMVGIGEPALLIPPGASPHEYSLRPSEARALSESQVVFWIGEELTPWLQKSLTSLAANAEQVALLELPATQTLEFREGATFEAHDHGHHDDEHGHDDEHHHHAEKAQHDHDEKKEHHDHHEHHDEKEEHHDHHDEKEHHDDKHEEAHHHHGVDPHAWLDPENARIWLGEISRVLSKLDPENANRYAENAELAAMKLDQLSVDLKELIQPSIDQQFIVFHDAYQYFENRLGISAAGAISLGDASDPSPARVAEIRDKVRDLNIRCVYSEPQYNSGLVSSVFEETQVSTIGVMDPLGADIAMGPDQYGLLLTALARSLGDCAL